MYPFTTFRKQFPKWCPKRFVTILSVVIMYTLDERPRRFFQLTFCLLQKNNHLHTQAYYEKMQLPREWDVDCYYQYKQTTSNTISTIPWNARTTETNVCGKIHGLFWLEYRYLWYHGSWLLTSLFPPLCNFNGHERNIQQRHLTAVIIKLIARTSLVWPTGVSKCGSHTYTFRALSGHISSLCSREVANTGCCNFIFGPSVIYCES